MSKHSLRCLLALGVVWAGCESGSPKDGAGEGRSDVAVDLLRDVVQDRAEALTDPVLEPEIEPVADVTDEASTPLDLAAEPVEETLPQAEPVVVVAVGDIANCSALGYAGLIRDPHELTADLVIEYPDDTPVLTLGDHVYSNGTSLEFAVCYEKAWGAFRDRTYPSPGNHDYNTDDAEPYFDYFGARAGSPDRGYYDFELGDWYALSLNSNCAEVPCDAESAQLDWLRDRLAENTSRCTLAYWHVPRWSSDRSGDSDAMAPFVEALYDAGVDLLLVGHAHNYERVARQTPDGELDPVRGIRQLVVGTGGAELRPMEVQTANGELFLSEFGILELTLYADRYTWRFRTIDGEVADSGEDRCHD